MASYGLKYQAEFQNTKKHFYRVRIYRRGYTGSSKTIGYVAGAALEVQGNQAEIIAPIIKTQLRVSIVDAADRAETSTVKYGDWQEFFTPDATLYKVVLGQSLNGTSYTDIWSGYITPDSWVEAIEYRGIITITARDGLGMLNDHPFEETGLCVPDDNGLISIYSILYEAGHVFEMPMDIVSHIGSAEVGYKPPRFSIGDYTDISIESALVNAALFEGMDWYQVLEQTLEAIGCAIRYNGQNALVIMALRDLPKLGRSDGAFEFHPVQFHGCTLEFDPAVKRIVEEQDYKQQAEVDFPVFDGLQFNAGTTYRCKTDGNELPGGGTVSIPEHDAAMNTLSNKGKTGWDLGSGMLNPASFEADDFLKRAEGEDGWRNYAFVAANQVMNGSAPVATYRFVTRTAAIKTTIRFTPNALSVRMSGSQTGRMMGPHYALANIKYYVMFTDGTTTRYWNGAQWTSTAILLEKEYDSQNQNETTLEIDTAECTDITVGTFVVELGQIIYKMWSDGGHGCYARVVEIKAEINSTTSIQSNKVTTINDDAFNVVLTRKPLFGALSQEVSFVRPSNYLAALFSYTSYGSNPAACPYNFRFGSETPVPLPVLIHQQILCYYFGAARVLNGNCAPIDNGRVLFDRICVYKNHRYIIQGGTLDLFSGILTNAVLREYLNFDELWAGVTPSYNGGPTYKADPASGGSGSGSSGGGGGGGYVLPIASASTLGGVKVGTGLSIDGSGVLSATGGGGGGSTVSVTDKASSHDNVSKIATISVDGVETDIYNDVAWGSENSTEKTVGLKVNGTTKNLLNGVPLATSSALGGIKVGYTQNEKNYPLLLDANNKAYVNVPWEATSIDGVSRKAPELVIYRGYNERQQAPFAPYLKASHPAIGAVTGAEFVLMVMSPRRMRNTGARVGKARKSWGAALGATGEGGLTFSDQVTLLDLRTYILQNYVSVYGQSTANMTYATYQSLTGATGFGHPNGTEAYYRKKIRRSRVFGIAVRWQNPAFSEMASGPLSDHTTEIQENGVSYQRWIYSDVAPIRVFAEISNLDGVASHNGGVIGFQLLP